MKLRRRILVRAAALLVAGAGAISQAGSAGHDLIPEETFRAAGLVKLTPEELEVLDRWIASYTLDIIKVVLDTKIAPSPAVQAAPRPSAETPQAAPSPPARPQAPPAPEPEPAALTHDFAAIEGAWIVGSDGELLGLISRDAANPDSLANSFGTYGSRFIPRSILNTFGPYGNGVSALSAFNENATRPPAIMKNGGLVAYLTKNEHLSPRVDPAQLLAWVQSGR